MDIIPIICRYFDPSAYRIVQMDQRGCGSSKPHAELRDNNTQELVADIEKLRVHLVGTEEGLIHLCTTEYASKYLATFQAHNTPVRKIEITTILSAVHKSGLHSGVEHIPAKCVHQLRGGVERQDLGHE